MYLPGSLLDSTESTLSFQYCPETMEAEDGAGNDNHPRREYEARAQKIKLVLKTWEADFADSHKGRKPGREDIKNNPSIAQKYKDYQHLRDIISGKLPDPVTAKPRREAESAKRKPDAPSHVETPLKRSKQVATPSKDQAHVDSSGLFVSPVVSRKLFSPGAITCLGPTPQRDGKVLGLFDLLVEKELGISPNKPAPLGKTTRAVPGQGVQATPRKQTAGQQHDGPSGRLGQTPTSSSRRRGGMGATFATPHKNGDGGGVEHGTPSSVSRLMFDTPAFLKRQKLPTLDEKAAFDDPAPLRLPRTRKPFTRGLSEIITSLRKVEEEQADDDLQALQEAIDDEMGIGKPMPQKAQSKGEPATNGSKARQKAPSDILKPDTEKPQLLGGFDDEGLYDSPVEGEEDGRPVRVYKKKGQKRTTRKVNMRPTRHRRPVNTTTLDNEASEEEEETQEAAEAGAAAAATEEEEDSNDSDQDFKDGGKGDDDDNGNNSISNEEEEEEEEEGEQPKKRKPSKPSKAAPKDTAVRKTARKVNELAHANFQRLKLRNRGAKGGPAHNSRFRRRR